MFGKLLKYEFKAIGKWYLAISSLILLLSLGMSFFVRMTDFKNPHVLNIGFTLSVLVVAFLIAAQFIVTLIVIIRRFYTNIFGREGYLTLTLPVNTHQIILSKLLTATILTLGNYFVLIASIFLIFYFSSVPDIQAGFQAGLNEGPNLSSALFLISTFTGVISGTMALYCAIALGQLFRNHRIGAAVISYFVLEILTTLLTSLTSAHFGVLSIFTAESTDSVITPVTVLLSCIYIVIAYFITHHIIKYKLDLQ